MVCYRGHTDAVLCLQFDQEKVVSGSKDKTIKVMLLLSSEALWRVVAKYCLYNTSFLQALNALYCIQWLVLT